LSVNLSPHFTLEELVRSTTAARLGYDNTPTPDQVEELRRLAHLVLEPLRSALGRPIIIESGFRSRQVNYEVRGHHQSEHLLGRAADIVVPGLLPIQVCETVRDLDLPFRQLIHEFRAWCHVSVAGDEEAPEQQCLTSYRQYGLTRYLPGLVP
jgi:hypothetical protein